MSHNKALAPDNRETTAQVVFGKPYSELEAEEVRQLNEWRGRHGPAYPEGGIPPANEEEAVRMQLQEEAMNRMGQKEAVVYSEGHPRVDSHGQSSDRHPMPDEVRQDLDRSDQKERHRFNPHKDYQTYDQLFNGAPPPRKW
eukprot:jgi/Chrzof1/1370/Cz10g05050.t1